MSSFEIVGLIILIILIITIFVLSSIQGKRIEKDIDDVFKIAAEKKRAREKRAYERYLEYLGEDPGEEK